MSNLGVKIISDGTPMGTRVIDPKTGNQLDGIFLVKVEVGVDDVMRAEIHCYVDELDVDIHDGACEFLKVNPLCRACKEDTVDATELGDEYKESVKVPGVTDGE